MTSIMAIAAITYKEAVRRKIFLILILFTVIVLASTALFPVVNRNEQLHLVELWTLRFLTLFAAIIAILVSATSLPGDMESKRIYTLLSKPVHKASLFIGKLFGFTLLLITFVLIMGTVSLLYITVLQLAQHGHTDAMLARPVCYASRVQAVGRHWVVDKRGTQKDLHNQAMDAVTEYPVPVDADVRSNRTFVLFGKEQDALVWVFTGLVPQEVDDSIPLEIKIRMSVGEGFPRGPARIVIRNPETGKTLEKGHLFSSHAPLKMQFPMELISSSGEVHVQISRADVGRQGNHYVIQAEFDHVIVYGKSHNFWLNYLLGLVLVWLQSMVVLSATTMASAFMSGPMSIFFGLFIFFVGNIYTFAQESNAKVERSIQVSEQRESQPDHQHGASAEFSTGLLKTSIAVSRTALVLLPNFDHFSFSKYLLKDLCLPAESTAAGLIHALPFIGAFMILGILVMLSKDFS